VTGKPTVADLGLDPGTQHWQRSGAGSGAIEVAFVQAAAHSAGLDDADLDNASLEDTDLEEWVLMRVTDDPEGRVLVFDRNEWECFLDGARKGEFDDAATPAAPWRAGPAGFSGNGL
jgi:hypothetical protein